VRGAAERLASNSQCVGLQTAKSVHPCAPTTRRSWPSRGILSKACMARDRPKGPCSAFATRRGSCTRSLSCGVTDCSQSSVSHRDHQRNHTLKSCYRPRWLQHSSLSARVSPEQVRNACRRRTRRCESMRGRLTLSPRSRPNRHSHAARPPIALVMRRSSGGGPSQLLSHSWSSAAIR
jgi:hypothetical protein